MSAFGEITATLRRAGNEKRAQSSAWFFKTGPGQYGEGDRFLGITVPVQRQIAKRFFADLSLSDIKRLLNSDYHEDRFTALEALVMQYEAAEKTGSKRLLREIYNFYLSSTRRINNWDLVDTSAEYIVGAYLTDKPRQPLYRLAKSKNLWERRIAMIACFRFIKDKDYADALAIAELLLDDDHDLIHKAVGWMLREIGNRNLKPELRFLNKHAAKMPRTALRYAVEKFPAELRQKYMKAKRM